MLLYGVAAQVDLLDPKVSGVNCCSRIFSRLDALFDSVHSDFGAP